MKINTTKCDYPKCSKPSVKVYGSTVNGVTLPHHWLCAEHDEEIHGITLPAPANR